VLFVGDETVPDPDAETEAETEAVTLHSTAVAVVVVVPDVNVEPVGDVVVVVVVVVVDEDGLPVGSGIGMMPLELVEGVVLAVDVEVVVVVVTLPEGGYDPEKDPDVGQVVMLVVSVASGVVSLAPPPPMQSAVSAKTARAETRAGVFMELVDRATLHILAVTRWWLR